MYQYSASLLSHHDGDTSKILVDLGFDISAKITVRWLGINAPELATPEGKAALDALNQKFPPGTACTITTVKDPALSKEKYGRYLANFTVAGEDLNLWMIANKWAVGYNGRGPKGVPTAA